MIDIWEKFLGFIRAAGKGNFRIAICQSVALSKKMTGLETLGGRGVNNFGIDSILLELFYSLKTSGLRDAEILARVFTGSSQDQIKLR